MRQAWRIAGFVLVLLAAPAAAFSAGDSGPPVAPSPAAPSAYEQGRRAADGGNWDRAAELFRRAVAENPRDHKAHNMLGYALRKSGHSREAIAAYNRALSLKPDYAPALEYRGVAHLLAGNRKAALADYQALRRLGSPLADDLREKLDRGAAH